jgi:hypothetical protein
VAKRIIHSCPRISIPQNLKILILGNRYDISESKTFQREVSPLLKIQDAYPKIVIARTFQPTWQHEGIQIVDAAQWLSKIEL